MFAATSTQMYASKKQSQPKHCSASCTPPRVLDLVHNVTNPMLQIATAAVEYQCPSPCITIERILITAATPKRETQKKWLSGHVHKQRGKEAKRQRGKEQQQDKMPKPPWVVMSQSEQVKENESKRMSRRVLHTQQQSYARSPSIFNRDVYTGRHHNIRAADPETTISVSPRERAGKSLLKS